MVVVNIGLGAQLEIGPDVEGSLIVLVVVSLCFGAIVCKEDDRDGGNREQLCEWWLSGYCSPDDDADYQWRASAAVSRENISMSMMSPSA